MEAEMVYGSSPLGCRWAPIASGTIASAILVIATVTQAQTINPRRQLPSADGFPTLMHRVADNAAGRGPNGFADLAEKVEPAVVGVIAKVAAMPKALPRRSFEFGMPDQGSPEKEIPAPDAPDQRKAPKTIEMMTIGSGFFVSPDGYAVTNSHVVADNDAVEIRTNDNMTYAAKVVGKDSLSDLALIKVDGRGDFSYVKLADQPPRVGDWVLTAGNPFGLGGTVTAGIVSARERNVETGSATDFIQIDAPINKGDSGGPTFDTRGDVIGVNSMIFSTSQGSEGVAFAIPADTVKAVIPQLKDKGTVTRGWIGAKVQSITPDLADSLGASNLHGAIVANVQDNGPAAKAGLRTGDVITSVNGEPVKNADELTKKVHAKAPGSSIQLAMSRQGRESSLAVVLGELPDQPSVSPVMPK
jgi:serine protease Do